MIVSVHQPQYLPWSGYFHKIASSDLFVFLDRVQYKEREFQNRNKIRTADGWMWLTVPVISSGQGRQGISEVRIDNSVNWTHEHWESLKVWYGKAEYFSEHAPFFEEVYRKKWDWLVDINLVFIRYCLNYLTIDTPITFESALKTEKNKTERIIEICQEVHADTYLSGTGGKEYLEEEKFPQANIKLMYQDFKHPVYRQQFMKGQEDFLPYMSVIDLMFNAGPASAKIIKHGGSSQ